MGNHGAAEPHRCAAEDLAQLLHLRGVTGIQAVPDTVAAAPSDGQFEMRLDGDIRIVSYAGMSTSLKDSRGLELLARLISRPDEELHVLDLVGSMADVAGGDSGPQLDEQAHAQYKRRIRTLQDELEEAESLADLGRVDALRGELDFITRELSRAFGLGARARRSGSDAERARINVRRRLKNAIDRIAEQLPDAGRYLDNTIKTGSYCKYSPM
jgi:hypothetical protein